MKNIRDTNLCKFQFDDIKDLFFDNIDRHSIAFSSIKCRKENMETVTMFDRTVRSFSKEYSVLASSTRMQKILGQMTTVKNENAPPCTF